MKFIDSKIMYVDAEKMKFLTTDQIKKLKKMYANINSDFYVDIDNKIYHKKQIYKRNVINELLGKLISEYFNDHQMDSKILKTSGNRYFLITDSFFQEGKKYTELNKNIFPKLKPDNNEMLELQNLDLLDKINTEVATLKTNKKDLIQLKYQLKMMIINDFLRKQSDRWFQNFLIEYSFTHCKLMPLFDFDYSFQDYSEHLKNSFIINLNDDKTISYIREDSQFQKLLYIAMDIDIKKVFEKLFDEYPVTVNTDEIDGYKKIITNQKNKIIDYKLLK